MRLIGMLAVTLTLSSCAVASKFKIDSDGMYRFKSQPIIVRAPSDCELDISVRDTPTSVDFSTGAGYWMASGVYALQVYTFDEMSIGEKYNFQDRAKAVAEKYIVNDRSHDFKFVLRDSEALEVNGRPAYQAVAVEEGKATFIATLVLHESRVTIASLLFPIEKPNDPMKRSFPWACYNRFVDSVKEIH